MQKASRAGDAATQGQEPGASVKVQKAKRKAENFSMEKETELGGRTLQPAQHRHKRLPVEDQKSLVERSEREEMTLSRSIWRPCSMEHISGRSKQHEPHRKHRNSPTLPSDPEARPLSPAESHILWSTTLTILLGLRWSPGHEPTRTPCHS